MRVTKKLLREVKRGLSKRLRELSEMCPSDLEREWKRCFPENGFPMSHEQARWVLVSDCLDRAIPDHWCK